MSDSNAASYDQVRDRLDEIVEAVNAPGISLDEALALYEEAVKLGLSACDLSEEGAEELQTSQPNRPTRPTRPRRPTIKTCPPRARRPPHAKTRRRRLRDSTAFSTKARGGKRSSCIMANKRILDVVDSPADLKLLTDDELSILAREIRPTCSGGRASRCSTRRA